MLPHVKPTHVMSFSLFTVYLIFIVYDLFFSSTKSHAKRPPFIKYSSKKLK